MRYDVIVIGAGHAGVEAATAAARMGAKTLLLTNSLENLGELSCNPAIGGIGKGTLIREIDALDGIIARATDLASINRKILNRSKGPAVHGLRHQVDRRLYKLAIKGILSNYTNLTIKTACVEEINIEKSNGSTIVTGVTVSLTTSGFEKIYSRAVVCTTGTFLNGKIIIGQERIEAGRINEKPSVSLGNNLRSLGLDMSRLKTGTPCRLDKNTINWSILQEQKSEADCTPFMSYITKEITVPQVSCFITHTNQKSHDIVLKNKLLIPTLNGDIKFKGPRYCPSIEDKVIRFSSKDRHQIFLEPEGLDSDLIYPNGISTSMSKEMQSEFIATIEGLENAKIIRFGYAIEYDFVNPIEMLPTLQTKKIEGLFLAGQILGTTGYEEAAGLGIVAGTNAALFHFNKGDLILDRASSYIGIMIDDLITNGVGGEPYRLFTSRSEYRLTCRSDNADFRLTHKGYDMGLVSKERYNVFLDKKDKLNKATNILNQLNITPTSLKEYNIDINQDGHRRSAFELLSSNLTIQDLQKIWPEEISFIENDIFDIIDIQAKYYHYIKRQELEIIEMRKNEDLKIEADFDFSQVLSLSAESIEKLNRIKPRTIGHAARVPGITPAGIVAIMLYIKNKK
jgi:tRNA uridine 5-carboxymethylaminomethyl modification enzyme